ncbi:head-tail adaptor [Cronobacter phage Dev-CD-23823]|uniref:Head to tail connector n=1 Tax=Cronobacter phage Dev-CD-23823 TaxID=1712539 RepID=A0A0K8IWL8_9CAUD|nr:head-tail adaptor [Cronobacter phage Dev-CD-23823]CUH74608.1 Head to tail connector [Cronobacter phage Dev-CD-23823]
MRNNETAQSRWQKLDAKRTGMLTRCERYAALTLPSVCPEDGYDEGTDELSQSLNSIGAQAVNSLVNKMMLACFAPSRPFMKFDLPPMEKNKILQATGMDENKFREELSIAEKEAIRFLESTGSRPKLYDLFAHLIITGNALKLTENDKIRIFGIKSFVSRRNVEGQVIELITKECIPVDELPENLQAFAASLKHDSDQEISYYRWWWWDGKKYIERQYLNDVWITLKEFNGQYKLEDMPAQHHTWRLPDNRNYGIGHVEDYIGDFEGLDQLTESEVNGAILASEFRWLANPGGMTRPEDIQASRNGDVVPGQEGDLALIAAGAQVAGALQVVSASADKYIRRIGQGFLLTSAVQRDAERVTAQEIRLLANELETGLGGIYSRLALDLQMPIARWLMKKVGGSVFEKSDFEPVIITGLDALSRNGDLENMQLFLGDVAQITSMPPQVQQYLKLDSIFSALAAGRGLRASDYINDQDTVDQRNAEAQKQAQQEEMQAAGVQAALQQQAKSK